MVWRYGGYLASHKKAWIHAVVSEVTAGGRPRHDSSYTDTVKQS